MYPKTFCQFLCCSPHSVLAVKLLHIHVHRCQVFLATTKNLVTLVMVVQSEHAYHNYGSYACTQVSHNLELLDGFLIWAQANSKDQVHDIVHTASSAACNVPHPYSLLYSITKTCIWALNIHSTVTQLSLHN